MILNLNLFLHWIATCQPSYLSEIENIRRGRNLNFVAEILLLASDNDESHATEFEYPFVLEFDRNMIPLRDVLQEIYR